MLFRVVVPIVEHVKRVNELGVLKQLQAGVGVNHPAIDTDGRLPIAIERDDLGLAKSADISSVQPRVVTDRVDRVLGQITDGTTPIAPSAFGSGTHPRNLTQISGTALTGRNWSSDFAYLPNLNIPMDEGFYVSDIRCRDETIALGEVYTVVGNTLWATKTVTVYGELVVEDSAEVRAYGS